MANQSYKDPNNKQNSDGMKDTSPVRNNSDKIFNGILLSITIAIVIALFGVFLTLVLRSVPSIKEYGFSFFTITEWNYRKAEVVTIDSENVTGKNIEVPNKMFTISFSRPMDYSTLNDQYISFFDSDGKELDTFIDVNIESSTNEVYIESFSPLKEDSVYKITILQELEDDNDYPLKEGYVYTFKTDSELTNHITETELNYAESGDVAKYSSEMDLSEKWFGAVPFVAGTLLTSIIALLISIPFSIAIAIFLGEYFPYGKVSNVLKTTNELLAAIPSVIYGFWAFGFLVPMMGTNILTASIVLAIMIIPYSASLAREVISMVPKDIKEAAYGMGATRFEVIKRVVIPYSASGIFAGILLAFGRALGETMAVTMVIGNKNDIPDGIASKGQTIASLIALEYGEATKMHLASLTELGLLLFLITMIFGLLGRYIIKKLSFRDEK